MAYEFFQKMITSAFQGQANFPLTDIYNEGWMLRFLMHLHLNGHSCFPFQSYSDSSWYSEAQIKTPFYHRTRKDMLAENRTHIDGVLGHFIIDPNTKSGFVLSKDATQFIVLEAKISSGLSKDVNNADFYDQASRTVACMAYETELSGCAISDLESAFYVVAPQQRVDEKIFDGYLSKENVRRKVKKRIEQYRDRKFDYSTLLSWYDKTFLKFVENLSIETISWESIIQKLNPSIKPEIISFYQKCLEYNSLKKRLHALE